MSVRQGVNTIAGAVGKYPLNERNITNCITEIPQDIKLELNNGTLTLKAGSKVYVPNGAGVFNEITIASDLTRTSFGSETTSLLYYVPSTNVLTYERVSTSSSGASHTPAAYSVWYDTANNVINRYQSDASTPSSTVSLPIAIIKTSSSAITSIDQIFNGFGYIGSTVFALPGLKVIKPNGRNTDGSLKNDSFTVNNVTTRTNETVANGEIWYVFDSSNHLSVATPGYWYYNDAKNLFETYSGGNTMSFCVFASSQTTGGVISGWNPKQFFHAVDYNDFAKHELIEFVLPTSANNYTWCRKYSDGWVEQGGIQRGSLAVNYGAEANFGTITLPVPMANALYFATASCDGYVYLINQAKTTTQYTPKLGAYTTNRTATYCTWYICGMAAS